MNAMARLAAPLVMLFALGAACGDSGASPAPPAPVAQQQKKAGGERDENARIDALIAAVESSGITFIRNGSEHDAASAASHLRRKRAAAGDDIATAEQFIDELATKSSVSGEPYRVRLADGTEQDAAPWFRQLLAEQDAKSKPPESPDASAAEPKPPVFPPESAYKHLDTGRYLAALEEAESAAAKETDLGPGSPLLDFVGLAQSFVGLEHEAQASFDRLTGEVAKPITSSPIDDAEALDALDAIVEAARDRRVVILNESHHMPRHRAFAAQLATRLRAIGFDTFAAETFVDAEGTQKRGWPNRSTGFYSREPVFGQLVRTVTKLGYRLVAYEWTGKPAVAPPGDGRARINARETGQAANLFERVFQSNPNARLFVYVGYSHATEDWVDKGGPKEQAWMAARLRALTGFDPLTIDQTDAMPRSDARFENPHWRRAVDEKPFTKPTVFRADGAFVVTGAYAGKIDMQVFHPPLTDADGRPDWLHEGRVAVEIPEAAAAALAADERLLVQAFVATEPDDAIPADQIVATAGTELPRLLLPTGTYRVVVTNAAGEELARVNGVEAK